MKHPEEDSYQKNAIKSVYNEREGFLIIGLTGRIGSGCSVAADIFRKETAELGLEHQVPSPAKIDSTFNNEKRQERIIEQFAAAGHWKPFDVIRVRDILNSFIMQDFEAFCNLVNSIHGINPSVFENEIKKEIENWEDKIDLNNRLWGCLENDHHFTQQQFEKKYFDFWVREMPKIGTVIREKLQFYDSFLYTKVYQNVGNIIRTYGKITCPENHQPEQSADAIYSIAKRINYVIKMFRKREMVQKGNYETKVNSPVRIVIDNIKNLFEATYLKDRYSAFYLMAILADENRRQVYLNSKRFDLTNQEWGRVIDYCERPSNARKEYKRYVESENLNTSPESNSANEFFSLVKKGEYPYCLWRDGYENETYTFNMRDVEACIQNADIFINNSTTIHNLTRKIVRYVSLMMHPGLVQPTADERCMQIAQTAKLNSGCISRQVGAVVCDSTGEILSIGWNEPSAAIGNEIIPCSYRCFDDLYEGNDQSAYSHMERNDIEFRAYLENNISAKATYFENKKHIKELLDGLPMAYCFKDIFCQYMNSKNQVHTRSQHGEEIALERTDRSRTKGGTLYTTSCSCELCAKKALHYGIARMVYVEPYPGITKGHVLGFPDVTKSSMDDGQMNVELFTGACHRAYTQLYTPVFPLKDELKLRGIEFKEQTIHKQNKSVPKNNNFYGGSAD